MAKKKKTKAKDKTRRKVVSPIAKKVGALTLGMYLPGPIQIHFRYIRNNLKLWVALFVAPFMAIKLSLIALFALLAEDGTGAWKYDLIAIFCVGLMFYLAERNRDFRRFYVYFVPAVMAASLLYWVWGSSNFLSAEFAVKLVLCGVLTFKVGNYIIEDGYQQLSEGADKNFHQGRIHYDLQEYDLAIPFLEKSAKRGHFKSIYLLAEAHEFGYHYPVDRVKAAKYFLKSGKKGYRKATLRYQSLLDVLTPDERSEFDNYLI